MQQVSCWCWPAPIRNFGLDMAWGVMPCGLAVAGAVDNRCPHCGAARGSVGHFVTECPSLHPLREWLQSTWRRLTWPGDAPDFGKFLVYGYSPRIVGFGPTQALQGALLAGAKQVRHARVSSEGGRTVSPVEMVRVAIQQLEEYMRLDWRHACRPVDWQLRGDYARSTEEWTRTWGSVVVLSGLASGHVVLQKGWVPGI
jgi:hypothetical protein